MSLPGPTVAPADPAVREAIVAFLRGIGLEVRPGPVAGRTVLPSLCVEEGVLVFDPETLRHPGDLLHEAGHLAVKLPDARRHASSDMGGDPAEEMMSIAWSYAAIRHLGLPVEVVFHPEGYRGGSRHIMENFATGRFFAVPMLQWIGLTHDDKRARELGVEPFPRMIKWLREAA